MSITKKDEKKPAAPQKAPVASQPSAAKPSQPQQDAKKSSFFTPKKK